MPAKLACLCFFVLVFAITVSAQKSEIDVTNVTKVTMLNPGLSYEARVAKFQTLYLHGFMAPSGYFAYSDALGVQSSFYLDPAADLQYRFYYNGMKRAEMEKRTEMNSMNYVTIMSEVVFSKTRLSDSYIEESNRRAITRFGVGWGMQRNYAKRFSLDLNMGFGYLMSTGTQYVGGGQTMKRNISNATFMGQLNLGFWLNRRKD